MDVGDVAAGLAGQDAAEGERAVEVLVTQALHDWRLDEAVWWQRVILKARLLRAEWGAC
jgi:hypothetical protein